MADSPLLDAAMDAWPWAAGEPEQGDRDRLRALGVPGPRWRARLATAGVPRLVIRALARRFAGKDPRR